MFTLQTEERIKIRMDEVQVVKNELLIEKRQLEFEIRELTIEYEKIKLRLELFGKIREKHYWGVEDFENNYITPLLEIRMRKKEELESKTTENNTKIAQINNIIKQIDEINEESKIK
ncbi:hypothetical protein ABET51_06770 [Metabacillus fastidiosus]|uniref:hypothetical protein n=1 Tax=Metabacillus fastidiosus TaxID=1458 RepID=UPI003D26A9BA